MPWMLPCFHASMQLLQNRREARPSSLVVHVPCRPIFHSPCVYRLVCVRPRCQTAPSFTRTHRLPCHCLPLPAIPALSFVAVTVGVGVGVGVGVNAINVRTEGCINGHSRSTSPEAHTDNRSLSPFRPSPVAYMIFCPCTAHPYCCMYPNCPRDCDCDCDCLSLAVPTPVVVSRLHMSSDGSSGRRIEPMIPGASCMRTSFCRYCTLSLHYTLILRPGADNSLLDGYTQLPPKGRCSMGPVKIMPLSLASLFCPPKALARLAFRE